MTHYRDKTRLVAGFIILALLSSCTSLPRLPANLAPKIELTDTPFFPQEAHQCGPAALATVLSYRQLEVTPAELTPQVFLPERKGSLQIELTAAARRHGMLAYPLAPKLSDLLTEVAAGNPVLVLQNLSFNWLPRWHYAVVVGYDLAQSEIILRSGKQRRWRSKLSTFSNTWGRSGNWALVILPADKIPQTATTETFLKAAYDLEATQKNKAALSAYRAATTRWPDDKRTWLALGNSAFGLNLLNEAHQALQQALSIDPADITALNNLAYVYLAAGCGENARDTISKALKIEPEDANLRDSEQEIDLHSSQIENISCPLLR